MNKQQSIDLLHAHMENVNLRRHSYAVSYAMGGIYDYLDSQGQLEEAHLPRETWEVFGMIHDSDYEITKDDWSKHTRFTLQWLEEAGVSKDDALYKAEESHNAKHTGLRSPETQMEWALECCDELTGFIVAVALMRPEKKLDSVEVKSVMKKWKQPAFARAVDRGQIEQCEEKLGIPLNDFIEVVLIAMKEHAEDLGL